MSATQGMNGHAFEWAVAEALSLHVGCPITDSDDAERCKTAWSSPQIEDKARLAWIASAQKSVAHICELEASALSRDVGWEVSLIPDSAGQKGDVRDVVLRSARGREIGISAKTHHEAFKSPRISSKRDFVQSWGIGEAWTQQYREEAEAIVARWDEYREAGFRWVDFTDDDKASFAYWPFLDAFEDELRRQFKLNPDTLVGNLFDFIVGKKDFYKVVNVPLSQKYGGKAVVYGYNMNETLSLPPTEKPSKLIGIDKVNGGRFTKNIRMNKGFTFNFRIHTASSDMSSSLKFDVTAISLPAKGVYQNHILHR